MVQELGLAGGLVVVHVAVIGAHPGAVHLQHPLQALPRVQQEVRQELETRVGAGQKQVAIVARHSLRELSHPNFKTCRHLPQLEVTS